MTSNTSIRIAPHFCGPPNIGNGGYVCGLLDEHCDYLCEVTLRKPAPLDKDLIIDHQPGMVSLLDGKEVIAVAKPSNVDLRIPAPISFEEATTAATHYIGHDGQHVFPECFVCGTERTDENSLRIFAGKNGDTDLFAAPWVPAASLAESNGEVKSIFLWAALDCPGAFAVMGDTVQTILLGKMTAKFMKKIMTGEQCVIMAWLIGSEGRKHYSGTAIYNERQELCGMAKSVWISASKSVG